MRRLQTFAAIHASVHNHVSQERRRSSTGVFKLNRARALAQWRQFGVA